MWYHHGSHPTCHGGEPFDLETLRQRDPSLKSSYSADDPCPNCGQAFSNKPFPVHCYGCNQDFYTDVIDLKRIYKWCPLCNRKVSKAEIISIQGKSHLAPQGIHSPQDPLQPSQDPLPPLAKHRPVLRQKLQKERLTFEDIIRYIVMAALGLVIAVPLAQWLAAHIVGMALGVLIVMFFFLPYLVFVLLASFTLPLNAATPQAPQQGQDRTGALSSNTDDKVIGIITRRRGILTDKRLIFLLGFGTGILFCYLLSRALEETRQTVQQLVETGTLSVALFGVLTYSTLYFVTLNKRFASWDIFVQGLILAAVMGTATIITLILIPALLGQPLSDDSVSIGIIINIIGSVLTTIYALMSTRYWQNAVR